MSGSLYSLHSEAGLVARQLAPPSLPALNLFIADGKYVLNVQYISNAVKQTNIYPNIPDVMASDSEAD